MGVSSQILTIIPGQRSDQVSTIVHEATHFRDTLGTSDHGYGVDVCKQLALDDPDEAVDNAE